MSSPEKKAVRAVANELLNIVNKVNDAIRSPRAKKVALSTVLAVHKPRIFESGLYANGAKIGTYSTRPASISAKNQARNTGQTYFPGGYSEYKTAIGKNPGYVILRNTDQMQNDYGLIQGGDEFGFGFQNQENHNKSIWMQDKYGKDIFALTDKEFEVFVTALVDELNK